MCESCGCHNRSATLKPPARIKGVAPNEWHVHADGTVHRHAHGHPGKGAIHFTVVTDSAAIPGVEKHPEATANLSPVVQGKA